MHSTLASAQLGPAVATLPRDAITPVRPDPSSPAPAAHSTPALSLEKHLGAGRTDSARWQELRAQYQRDGVVVVRNVFDSHDLQSLLDSIEASMANPSAYATEYEPDHEEDGGRFFGDYYMFRRIPGFREFIFESPSAELACRMLQSAQVNFFCAHSPPLRCAALLQGPLAD